MFTGSRAPRRFARLTTCFAVAAAMLFVSVQAQAPLPDLLPVATTLQVPLTAAYNALNVPALAAGGWYLDPTTSVKIYKLTSATFPASSPNWGHDYSEGGDEVSLPYDGNTRAVLVRQNGGSWWLVDFTPDVGVSNPRQLTGNFAPFMDLAFTFSNNPATPYYAYVSRGSIIRRFDIRTMTEVPGGGWPVTGETSAMWLHQSENDGMFVWMRGATGSTIVAFEPATNTKKTYTNANLNEPRIDRAGRYVGLSMGGNALFVWDWNTSSIIWSTSGDPGIPFAHNASLKRRWMSVDWNMNYPPDFTMFIPDVPNSAQRIGGPANGSLIHGNGNWIQHPADLNDQWAVFTHYGSLRPPENFWLAPGGMVLITPNGQRRLLGHPYNSTNNYTFFSFAKFSPDGKYVLFTSNMNGAGRSDVFLAELPSTVDATPPTVALTSPVNNATVSGTVTVSASAVDNVGVIGVQFKLDGANLGAEDTTAPYAVSWDTTTATNGIHALTAVARDAAGNSTTSVPVTVTVANVVDVTPPVISGVSASGISPSGATIGWTTNEPADSQVEYGPTATYGSSTPLDATMVTAHAQTLSGLSSNTLYHYRVKSRDAAGNLATSGDFTFTTLAAGSGLIGHWPLDEGNGTVASDASGNGNTATLINGPVWGAGRINQALSFDGIDDYLNAPHNGGLNPFPMTIAVWLKTGTTAGVRGIVNKYVAGSYNGYNLFVSNGNLCAWYLRNISNYVYDGGGCTLSTAGYNDNLWHHVAYVVDASGGKLYVDGAQRASLGWTGPAGAPTTTQPVHVGHYPGAAGGAEYLPGAVDDVRLYNRALTAADVLSLYTAPLTAAFIHPLDGALDVDVVTRAFEWTAVQNVQAYYLWVGTAPNTNNLVNTGEIQQTSYLAANLPEGQTLYANIWAKVGGIWRATASTFRTTTFAASWMYPIDGATDVDLSQLLTWTSVPSAQAYYLWIGSAPNTNDLVNTGEIQQTSYLASNLPAGRTVYATIWTKVGGVWRGSAITFTTAVLTASWIYPTDGATNVDLSQPLTWTSVPRVQAYYLWVGSAPGTNDLVNTGEIQQTLYLASNLPAGRTVYATIWTKMGGVWRGSAITFTTAVLMATWIHPTDGATNVDVTRPFEWTSVPNAQAYYLWVGTAPNTNNLVNTGEIQQTSYLAANLPAGQTLYAIIWTKVAGVWRPTSISFSTRP